MVSRTGNHHQMVVLAERLEGGDVAAVRASKEVAVLANNECLASRKCLNHIVTIGEVWAFLQFWKQFSIQFECEAHFGFLQRMPGNILNDIGVFARLRRF